MSPRDDLGTAPKFYHGLKGSKAKVIRSPVFQQVKPSPCIKHQSMARMGLAPSTCLVDHLGLQDSGNGLVDV